MAATEDVVHWWSEVADEMTRNAEDTQRRALIEALDHCGQRETGELELLDPWTGELARIEIVGFVR